MANNQSVRRHLNAFTRGQIIGKLEEGRSVTRTAIRGFSSGRPRGTTPADDRYIVLQARRNRRQTTEEIAIHTTQATGRPVSRFTVARRRHGGGRFARRPVRCVPLTPAHRRRRSLWCREHRNWRDNEWGRVLFTDESRFSLSSDSHRILTWRERGSRNHPSNIIERDRYGGRGVLVWGGIMLGSRTDIHIFDAGSVNGTRYCNETLLPYVRLFRGAMGLQFLFMDDNAPCHRTVAAEQLLESEDIERMDWPARSPDLNPIEYVWDFLGSLLAARTLPPVTIRELRLALQDEWAALPQQFIDTLILSMGRRCETCLAARTAAELSTRYLQSSELSCLKKIELNQLGKTPPGHPWYFGKNPEGSYRVMPREYQTAFSRFVSGRIKARQNARIVKPVEIHRQLVVVDNENVISDRMMRNWIQQFNDGCTNVHGETQNFCEEWFLPESVARVAAIVGDPRCHTPGFKEILDVILGYSRTSSFHTLPKLIWCGSWGCNLG
ncbi:transposable element Tcb2 transposase [Trichonephila clavipes]|nr:transposable element Tcb2 transposase [Trichonephila clavipes]